MIMMRKIFVCFSLLLLLVVGGISQEEQRRWFRRGSICERCENHFVISPEDRKKLASISQRDTRKRAIKLVTPPYPPTGIIESTIIVVALIDIDGNVECIRVMKGHPILSCAVASVSKDWKFKPLIVEGKPVAFIGQLYIRFKRDGKVNFVNGLEE